jgi:hypothetical protein
MINFYGLMYFSQKDLNPNLSIKYMHNKNRIFCKNAENLSHSLTKQGLKFTLLTNNKIKCLKYLDAKVEVVEIKFNNLLKYPIKFNSAHYKIDVLKYLSKKKTMSCLIDLDVIAINKIPNFFFRCKKKKINMLYDLHPKKRYHNNILNSLNICNNSDSNLGKHWYGGEFIFATPKFFFRIHKEIIDKIYINYIKNYNKLYHVGDEMLLNAAIQNLGKKISFIEISQKKIISRYWSINTIEKKKNIKNYLNSFLLHLPADKKYLSKINMLSIDYNEFKKFYLNYLNSFKKIIYNKLQFLYRRIYGYLYL